MNASTNLENVLAVIARAFLWCFVLGFVFLMLAFAIYFVAGDWAYGIHSQLYDISEHEFSLIFYVALAWLKMTVFVFFLLPYLALRLTLRGVRKGSKA